MDVDDRRLEHHHDATPTRSKPIPSPDVSLSLSLQRLFDRHSAGSSSTICYVILGPSAISSESYVIRLGMVEDWAADPASGRHQKGSMKHLFRRLNISFDLTSTPIFQQTSSQLSVISTCRLSIWFHTSVNSHSLSSLVFRTLSRYCFALISKVT